MEKTKSNVICGNSLKILPQITDKYFDLVLTDPPYNLGKNYGELVNDSLSHQEYLNFSRKWFLECKRISKGIVFTPGWNQLKMWLTEIEYPKGIVIWYNKNQMSHSNLGGWNHWEPILVYGTINFGKNVFNVPVSVQKLFKSHKTEHPNPKPVKLMYELLKSSNPKPKKVIDPFMGIGTTLMACKLLGISCCGIDINQQYVDETEIYLENTKQTFNINNFIEYSSNGKLEVIE